MTKQKKKKLKKNKYYDNIFLDYLEGENMDIGEIIIQENLVFSDGKKDEKKGRPCIYLYSEIKDGKKVTYSIPLTSKLESFNRQSDRYAFIPEVIYNNKKLSFARVDNVVEKQETKITPLGIKLNRQNVILLIKKMQQYDYKNNIEFYRDILNMLSYIEKIEEQKNKPSKQKKKIKQIKL